MSQNLGIATEQTPTAYVSQLPFFWPQTLSKRLLLLLFFGLSSGLTGWQTAQLYEGEPPEIHQQLAPARHLLEKGLGLGHSHIEVVQYQPLDLVATVDCSPEEAHELDTSLRNLLSLNPALGERLLTVRGPIPTWHRTRAGLVSTYLFLLLLLCTFYGLSRRRPAPVAALVCHKKRRRLFGLLRKQARPGAARQIVNGKQEAAIVLMSIGVDEHTQTLRQLGPEAVKDITATMQAMPACSPQFRDEVLATFQAHLDIVCRRTCGKSCQMASSEPAKIVATLVEFYLSSVVNGDLTERVKASRQGSPRIASWARAHIWKLVGLALISLILGSALHGRALADPARPKAELLRRTLAHFIASDRLLVEVCQRNQRLGSAVIWRGRPDPSEILLMRARMEALEIDPAGLSEPPVVLTPGFPRLPVGMDIVAEVMLWLLAPVWFLRKTRSFKVAAPAPIAVEQAPEPIKPEPPKPPTISQEMQIDPVSIQVGRALLKIVDPKQGAPLLERMKAVRRHTAMELGIILPGVRFRDNLGLKPNTYQILIRETRRASGEVFLEHLLAIGPTPKIAQLKGEPTFDPSTGLPALWITKDKKPEAEKLGCMIFDPISVMAMHFTQIVRQNAAELLGRQELQALLDVVKKTHPAVVNAVYPAHLNLGELQKVMHILLSEKVTIRDLVLILETLADRVHLTKDPDMLAEFARVALRYHISKDHSTSEQIIFFIQLSEEIESAIEAGIDPESISSCQLPEEKCQAIFAALEKGIKEISESGLEPIVLTSSPMIRPALRKLTERCFPELVVLSPNDIAPSVRVRQQVLVSL